MSDLVSVVELKPGDRFIWCGRVADVQDIKRAGTYARGTSRRLLTEFGWLHYFDDEEVQSSGFAKALAGVHRMRDPGGCDEGSV